MSSAAAKKYKQTAVQSASKEKLLLMLYEGAIKYTKMAIAAMENNNIKEKCECIGRAYDIVLELNNTLDHKIGGDLAVRLEQLYMFMSDQYIKANTENNPEPLRTVLKLLETLNEGWVGAVQKLKNNG